MERMDKIEIEWEEYVIGEIEKEEEQREIAATILENYEEARPYVEALCNSGDFHSIRRLAAMLEEALCAKEREKISEIHVIDFFETLPSDFRRLVLFSFRFAPSLEFALGLIRKNAYFKELLKGEEAGSKEAEAEEAIRLAKMRSLEEKIDEALKRRDETWFYELCGKMEELRRK